MKQYFPMPAEPGRMPIDISFLFADERPAGKHGFLQADGEQFRFEDGTPARFWGVNVNGACCFPTHEQAEDMARRIAQSGCNMVRLHQLDAEFSTPNIFNFSRGRFLDNTRQLDERSLERLDYFIHCLKQEGIYLFLDMMTYREFRTGDGVDAASELIPAAKPWCTCEPKLIELQKEFATQLWTHCNPYTGLCYKDEPAFVMTEVVNECDLFTDFAIIPMDRPAVYVERFRQRFAKWLEEKGIDYDWQNCDLKVKDEPLEAYKLEVTSDYYRQMRDHLRSIGVRIPINGTNWNCVGSNFVYAQRELDFMDTHPYITNWAWGNNRSYYTKSITETRYPPAVGNAPRMRMAGKPFVISEWDMPWPSAHRAEGTVYYAAISALQGWSAVIVHTYAYDPCQDKLALLGRETPTAIGGSLAREGTYTVWNDWARFGMFYHGALMLRRGDVAQADYKVGIMPKNRMTHASNASRDSLEQFQAGLVFDEKLPEGYDRLVYDDESLLSAETTEICSCTGQLRRDLVAKKGIVDSPSTKAVYGKLEGSTELAGMRVETQQDWGVIALSSLSDAPIATSQNMLLSVMGDVRNQCQSCKDGFLEQLGTLPIEVELVKATITLDCPYGEDMCVWGIGASGNYVGKMPVTVGDGTITFTVGDPNFPACYYLIFRQ